MCIAADPPGKIDTYSLTDTLDTLITSQFANNQSLL
jgi:hypothetical protein